MKSMFFCTTAILSLLIAPLTAQSAGIESTPPAPLSALDIELSYKDDKTITLTGDIKADAVPVTIEATNSTGVVSGKKLIKRIKGGVGVDNPLLQEDKNPAIISKSSWTMTFEVPIPEGQTLTFTHVLPKVGPMNGKGDAQNGYERILYTDVTLTGRGVNNLSVQAVSEPLNYSDINTHEASFGRPITVTGPFKVSVRLRKKAQGENTQCYAGLNGLVFRHEVAYGEQKPTCFYGRKEAVETAPATISLSNGWKLKTLTMTQADNAAAPATQWVQTTDTANPDIYFTPNTNIGNGGVWTAEFEAPEGGVLMDALTLSVARLGGIGTSQGNERRGAHLVVYADEMKLFEYMKADTKDFDASGSFTLRRVKILKIECKQNPYSKIGCYIGLKRFSYRHYVEFSGRTEASADNKTPASIVMNHGWRLKDWSMTNPVNNTEKWLATVETAGFVPNTNVGDGGSWNAVFELPEAMVTDSLLLRFLRLNSGGTMQSGGYMLLTAKLSDGRNETVLCDKRPIKVDSSANIRLFYKPTKGNMLTLICEQDPKNKKGAFFALEGIYPWSYDHASAVVEGKLENGNAVRTVLVNPTSWPIGEVGAVVLTDETVRLPEVLKAAQDPLKTPLFRTYSAYKNSISVPTDAEPRVFMEAAMYIGGGFSPASSIVLRPGDKDVSVLKTEKPAAGLRLSVVKTGFFTDPAEALLYAKSGDTADGETQWWHSDSAGAEAVQGALPPGAVGKIWLEGGCVKLADGTKEMNFHGQTTGGVVEIAEGRTATLAAATGSGESHPSLPKGVSLELGGSLKMDGTLPSMKVISKTASLATETGLTVNSVEGDATTTALTIADGTVSLQNASLPLTLNGGSLAVTSEPQTAVTMPSLTVAKKGDLQISAESLTLTDLAVNADLTLAGSPLTVTHPVTGTGRILLTTETDVTEAGIPVLTGTLAEGASVSAGVDGRSDLWFAVRNGQIVLTKIGGSKPSESGSPSLNAAYEKLYADAVKVGLPVGTKKLVYQSKRTSAGATPETNADVAVLAASLFGLTPSVADTTDENGNTAVTVAYDFGITDMKATSKPDGSIGIVVDVSVQKPGIDGPEPADYAANCGLRLRLLDKTLMDAVETDTSLLPKGTRRFTANLPAGVTLFKAEAFAKEM